MDREPSAAESRTGPATPTSRQPRPTEPAEGEAVRRAEAAAEPVELDIERLLSERDQFKDIALRLQADFENYRRRMSAQTNDEIDRATGRVVEALLPVLDACEAAFAHGADRSSRSGRRSSGRCRSRAWRRSTCRTSRSTPRWPRRWCTSRAIDDVATPGGLRDAAHGLPVEGSGAAPGDGEGHGGDDGPAAGVVREGLLQGARRRRDRVGQGDHQGLPEARAHSTTPTPTRRTPPPRSASRRSRPRTTCSATRRKRKEYDEVRRLGPVGGYGPGGFGSGGFGGVARPGGFSFDVGADDVGDLLGNLFGRGRRAARGSSGVGPQRGADLEAELHARLRGRRPGHDDHALPDLRRGRARRARARAPSPAPRRAPAASATAAVSSTTTRASSPSPRRARPARAGASSIDDPCPTCRGSGVERRPREVKVRIPAGVADGQRIAPQGSRRARAATAGRPATCT